ncbi:MAG: YqaA family protein [Gammaproteobacteria bacterium]
MQEGLLGLSSLFVSSFISSTIAPGGSEAVLALMVSEHVHQIPVLLVVATVGNTLGAMTTWYLGLLAAKKYPAEALLSRKKQKAVSWVKQWGRWALLFSWLPVVGDGFCFAGGWLKFSVISSALIILIGKFGRYAAIAYVFAGS